MSEAEYRVTSIAVSKNNAGRTFATVSVHGPVAEDKEEREAQIEQLRLRVAQLFSMSSDHMISGVVGTLNEQIEALETELSKLKVQNAQLTQDNIVLRRSAGWSE